MKRLLLFLLFATTGMAVLGALAGGFGGITVDRDEPEVDAATTEQEPTRGILAPVGPPVSLHTGRNIDLDAAPEPLRFTDAATGETVLVPEFIPWSVRIEEAQPEPEGPPGRQAALVHGVRLTTYREPRTLAEARALAEGIHDARAGMVQWRVTAPHAVGLMPQLDLQVAERHTADQDLTVRLSGGVLLVDEIEGVQIQGEDIELQPYLDRARGEGPFRIDHPSYTLTGKGLVLRRDEEEQQVHVLADAELHLEGHEDAREAAPGIDLGSEAFRTGTMRAPGGALLVRRRAADGGEALAITLTEDVHLGQEGGRSLDAEEVRILARRGRVADGPWEVLRFQALGGVVAEYPGRARDGEAYVVSIAAREVDYRRDDDGRGYETILRGRPLLVLRGDIPLQGRAGDRLGAGTLRASCSDEARLRPARAVDVPPGEDPAAFRRLALVGRGRLTRRPLGEAGDGDTLEADRIHLLLRREGAEDAPADLSEPLVATAFACEGDVTMGGPRITGTTQRLVGEGLDGALPVLVAEGAGTDLTFLDLDRDERLLGGRPRRTTAAAGADGEAGPPGANEDLHWALDHLLARGRVDIQTTLGGPTVGLPARVEGEELAYERVSDRARLLGDAGGRARITVGETPETQQTIAAHALTLERGRAEVEARGEVRGTFLVADDAATTRPSAAALDVPEAAPGPAARLRIQTDGRIEVHPQLDQAGGRLARGERQAVRIDGPLVGSLVARGEAIDTLRAETLEIGLVRIPRHAGGDRASSPLARPASAAAPSRGPSTPTAPPAPRTTWRLEAGVLRASLAEHGLDRLEAAESVRLESDEGALRGDRLIYEDGRETLTVVARPGELAHASYGPRETRSEVEARLLEARWEDGALARLVGRGPGRALLLRRPDDRETIERFVVLCQEDMVVTPTWLATEGPVEIRRMEKDLATGAWGPPATLWSENLRIEGAQLLRRDAAIVEQLAAWGPSTTFQTGVGDRQITVWGDRFALDVPANVAVLTGTEARSLRIRRGPEGEAKEEFEQSRIAIDVRTGLVREWDAGRVTWHKAR